MIIKKNSSSDKSKIKNRYVSVKKEEKITRQNSQKLKSDKE